MKKLFESTWAITPESIVNYLLVFDIPEFRDNLRVLMNWWFLYCKNIGTDSEPAWRAVQAVDQLLEMIYEYKKGKESPSKAIPLISN